jgi:membrane dipeptidase
LANGRYPAVAEERKRLIYVFENQVQSMSTRLLIDGHLDLAMNAISRDRDQRKPVADLREREREIYVAPRKGSRFNAPKGRGVNTVALPEMRRGGIGLTFATLTVRVGNESNNYKGYDSQQQCHADGTGQLAYYQLLEDDGEVRLIRKLEHLESHLEEWETAIESAENDGDLDDLPVGIVVAMEGADPILSPVDVHSWWDRGLRIASLSHYGRSTYAHGTTTEGGLTADAPPVLAEMEDAGMILDMTHLADQAFWEALDAFDGPVVATHNNARHLVPGQRQFNDEQLRAIIDRDGVIGVALDAVMIQPGWELGVYNRVEVTIADVVDHIEHICSLANDTRHVAVGSDLDGGYGLEQVPRDLDTIEDLQKIGQIMKDRGFSEQEIDDIFTENWIRILRGAWDG